MNKSKIVKLVEGILAALILAVLAGGGILYVRSGQEPKRAGQTERPAEEIQLEEKIDAVIENKEEFTVKSRQEAERGPAETDAQTAETHRYEIIPRRMTYTEAKEYCEEQGGHLATVTSQQEYEKILELAKSSSVKVLWLGAENTAAGFEWVTGEPFGFTDWAEGEPNNDGGNEHYLVMYSVKEQWVWSDVPLDLSPYYGADKVGMVCEWDS